MDFKAFDKKKQLEYAAKAKERWGGTDAYAQFAQKASGRTEEAETTLAGGLMGLFAELGTLERNPASAEAQAWARRLQAYISEHYYDCTKPILKSLGQMYADGGEMNANIDHAGGKGTGAFAKEILDIFCG